MADSLIKGGERAVAVTSNNRATPADCHLVGTAIVNTGVNIRPPPAVGVTSGEELVSDRGELRLEPTSSTTHTQQMGRFGREGVAIFIHPPKAGTGIPTTPYPDWHLFTNCEDAMVNFSRAYGLNLMFEQVAGTDLVGFGVDKVGLPAKMSISQDARDSLEAYYKFSTTQGGIEKAIACYVSWCQTGTLAPGCEQLRQELRGFNRRTLLTARALRPLIDSAPFRVRVNDKVVACKGL